jgi:transcriptional regulator with XRE-family HTH domain
MKRGRPKGRSRDKRSFGPLGDLIRQHRLKKGLGLLDVAQACECSVQFISNIEHGRAPLPWEKVEQVAKVLEIPVEEVQVANLAVRSDFQSFVGAGKGKKVAKPLVLSKISEAASALTFAAQDPQIQEVILKYQSASQASRKRFIREAFGLLKH